MQTNVEVAPIADLKQHPKNPRKGDIDSIVRGIQENGWYGAVVAQRSTGYVLVGNHRIQAARKVGIEEVPVMWLDVDDDKALRILLSDNRISDIATYDNETLANLLDDIMESTGDLGGTGYNDDDLMELVANLNGATDDEWAKALGVVPDGDREPFQQMTFTLHDDQAARVKQAIDRAKATENLDEFANQNTNGNALAAIAEAYING